MLRWIPAEAHCLPTDPETLLSAPETTAGSSETKARSSETTATPPETAARPKAFYRPELDVLRFFAFFCVFLLHTVNEQGARSRFGAIAAAAGGSLSFAVSLFFLLSAFLITTLLEIELDRTGTVHTGAFYVRRITRIWPLYYFFLAICVVLGGSFEIWRMSFVSVAAWVLMAGNWYVIAHGSRLVGAAVLWSVNIEEQFYLFCPWFVSLFRRRGLVAFSVATVFVSQVFLCWMGHHGNFEDTSIRLNTLTQVLYFAVGTLLASGLRGRSVSAAPWGRLPLFLAGLALWTSAAYLFLGGSPAGIYRWWSAAAGQDLGALGCLAIFFSFYGMKLSRTAQPLVYLGKISYGLYLYHILFVVGVRAVSTGEGIGSRIGRFALSLGLTIATASASYAFLEKPFLRLKERFTFVRSRAA